MKLTLLLEKEIDSASSNKVQHLWLKLRALSSKKSKDTHK